jgi:predicted helicase
MYPILRKLLESVCKNWDTLESRIIALPTPQKRGEAFEEFCHAFFILHKDLYQTQNVWRCADIPQNILQRLGTPTFLNRGIDEILQCHDGIITAYQAKFRIFWDC